MTLISYTTANAQPYSLVAVVTKSGIISLLFYPIFRELLETAL